MHACARTYTKFIANVFIKVYCCILNTRLNLGMIFSGMRIHVQHRQRELSVVITQRFKKRSPLARSVSLGVFSVSKIQNTKFANPKKKRIWYGDGRAFRYG